MTYFARAGSAIPRPVSMARLRTLVSAGGGATVYARAWWRGSRYCVIFEDAPTEASFVFAEVGTEAIGDTPLLVPEYETGLRFVVLLVNVDMRDLIVGGSSSVGIWAKADYRVSVAGTMYDVWATGFALGGLSGSLIEIEYVAELVT